jgi:hypothetical protein
MRRFLLLVGMILIFAATAAAQGGISGTALFGKADPQHMIPAGDKPEHMFAIDQRKCTWTKAMEIGTDKAKEGTSTATHEIFGAMERSHGAHVTTMESGDKYFVSYQGTGTMKDGVLQSERGTWSFTGGTGKLKLIDGVGSYTCTASGDGVSCDIQGDYRFKKP